MAKSGFKEEPMAEGYLKRSSGVHGHATESVLAFLGMKSHRDTIQVQKKRVSVYDKMEGEACLAKLQHYQKHQKHYNAIEKSKIIHWGRCQPRYSISDLAIPVERENKATGSFAEKELKEEILPEPFHVLTDSPKCFIM